MFVFDHYITTHIEFRFFFGLGTISPSLAAFGRPEPTLTPLFLRCNAVPDPCFRVLLGDCQKQNNGGDLGDRPSSSSISSPIRQDIEENSRVEVDQIEREKRK